MRRSITTPALLALATVPVLVLMFSVLANAETSRDTDIEKIKQLNRDALWALLVEQDPEPLDRLALDNFIVIAPGGRVENKQQAIAGVASLDVKNIELSDEQVVFHGDTAVLVGKLDADGTMQPLGELPTMKYMAVFVRADGEWRMLSRAITPCAPIAVKYGVC